MATKEIQMVQICKCNVKLLSDLADLLGMKSFLGSDIGVEQAVGLIHQNVAAYTTSLSL